jgi:two-component system, NarL family, sensor kinase
VRPPDGVAARNWTAEAERIVAWMRLPAIVLLAVGEGLEHPNPQRTGFVITLTAFSAWSAGVLAWVHIRDASPRFALAATAVDIVAISGLAVLSGGAFSHARLAFFLVPVTVAFRFRPAITAAAAVVTTAAYVIQAAAHPAIGQPQALRFVITQAGFLAWVGLACFLLSRLLASRTELASRLADERSRLLDQTLSAEQRERKALAESLHDHALQNLLSARHELEEATESTSHPSLGRADTAVAETLRQLRDAVFDLHPYVLEEVGLEAAVRTIAQRAAEQADLKLSLDLHYATRHPREQQAFSVARELVANVVQHAGASRMTVRLGEVDHELRLYVEDDGRGFPPERLAQQLADGHVGLASQRARIEAAGGRMEITSSPGDGTSIRVALPAEA